MIAKLINQIIQEVNATCVFSKYKSKKIVNIFLIIFVVAFVLFEILSFFKCFLAKKRNYWFVWFFSIILLTFTKYYNIMRICIKINFKNYAIMCLSPKIFTTEYVFRGNWKTCLIYLMNVKRRFVLLRNIYCVIFIHKILFYKKM